jgi:hypothetical protein
MRLQKDFGPIFTERTYETKKVILKITFGNKNDYEYRYMATCLHHFENEGGKNDTFETTVCRAVGMFENLEGASSNIF